MKNKSYSKRLYNFIYDNSGSTLLTVLVAIGICTVLAAIILTTTMANLFMKGIDRRAKDEFYYAEQALNDIYTKIGQNVQNQSALAYEAALVKVGRSINDFEDGDLSNSTKKDWDFKTAEEAENYYRVQFKRNVKNWLQTNYTASNLASYIVDNNGGTRQYEVMVSSSPYSEEISNITVNRITVIAKDMSDNSQAVQAIVSSEIFISIPQMNFFGTNADIVDYGIVANKGIIVENGLTAKGNVYAGTNGTSITNAGVTTVTPGSGSGINILEGVASFDSQYLVSKGCITVGSGNPGDTQATLNVKYSGDSDTNMWTDSIITKADSNAPVVNIVANVYTLNDLELDSDDSTVNVSGSYFGYGDGTLRTYGGGSVLDASSDHANSSAVIINGNKSALNMKNVSTFVLMGKAYVEPTGSDKEIATAEGVALMTNQQIYLIPTDFLSEANPSAGSKDFSSCTIPDTWFAYKYLKKTGSGPTEKADLSNSNVEIKDNSGNVIATYAFLDFIEFNPADDGTQFVEVKRTSGSSKEYFNKAVYDANANSEQQTGDIVKVCSAQAAYVREILNGAASGGTNPGPSQLKTRINLSISNENDGAFHLQNCVIIDDGTVADEDKTANVYATNAVSSYYHKSSYVAPTPGTDPIPVTENFVVETVGNTAAMNRYTSYPQNLFNRFKWLCADLNNMSNKPISGVVKSPEAAHIDSSGNPDGHKEFKDDYSWGISSDYPYKYFVNTTSASDISVSNTDNTEVRTSGTFLLLDGTSTPAEIPASVSSPMEGVIICNGDLKVRSGFKLNGLIIASGTVTFEGNNEIKADRAVIQKMIEEESKLVRKNNNKYRDDYLISYLADGNGNTMYKFVTVLDKKSLEETEFRYTDYMYLDNWEKGE